MNSGRSLVFVFSEPLTVTVQEGSVANFTVLRNGSADVAVAVHYITVNGDATAEEGDFVPSGKSSIIWFDIGEREGTYLCILMMMISLKLMKHFMFSF